MKDEPTIEITLKFSIDSDDKYEHIWITTYYLQWTIKMLPPQCPRWDMRMSMRIPSQTAAAAATTGFGHFGSH